MSADIPPFNPCSILVAEDDPILRHVLQTWLAKWHYHVVLAHDGDLAWQLLQAANAPTLVLLDWMMPGMDGLGICREIRKQVRDYYTYILILTSRQEKQDILAGLEAGADDYLIKPFDPDQLRARLQVGRRILALQQELITARERLRFEATHDSLTAVWNRRAILELLSKEVERARRTACSVGVLMADLDWFKHINDHCGHLVGDGVLREVAGRLVRSTRTYDHVGRYGGEEFLIVLPGCAREEVLAGAERVRLGIAEQPFVTGAGNLAVTISVGVSWGVPGPEIAGDAELVHLADAGLYRAKETGRNRVAHVYRLAA
jgi:diguanylate cyclase (GGDEF)-like protein